MEVIPGCRQNHIRFDPPRLLLEMAAAQKKNVSNWGHHGDKKERLGMILKLLTDARETSYWICSSLLTAECSTIELPGNRIGYLFLANYTAGC